MQVIVACSPRACRLSTGRGEVSFLARDEGFFEDVCEMVPEKKFISEKLNCDVTKKIFLVRNIRCVKNVKNE